MTHRLFLNQSHAMEKVRRRSATERPAKRPCRRLWPGECDREREREKLKEREKSLSCLTTMASRVPKSFV